MYVRSWKKGSKILIASIVKSVRIGKKVKQEIIVYLGEVIEEQLPYLKATYAKNKFTTEGKGASTIDSFAKTFENQGGKIPAIENVSCDMSPAFISGN
jgi:hypothetical protein